MTSTFGNDPFVGREREMDQLDAALESALQGHGQLVMLVGDPGIGKTRVAEELADHAKQRGAEVLWGRCPEERGAPPYWPWVQIIRAYVGGRDAAAIRDMLGSGAAAIGEVVAEIRETQPELKTLASLGDPDAERFRLFDAVTSFLKRAASDTPLVLILDDLQWSDESPLRLLEFISRELADTPILIVGAYRRVDVSRSHPLFRTLGDLTRQRLFTRIPLRGLEEEQVGSMIAGKAESVPPSGFVKKIHSQTEGNPLFVVETVRLLAEEGLLQERSMLDPDNWLIRLPEGIRETISRRLARLSDETNQILTVAAVVGRQFELGQLSAIESTYSEDNRLCQNSALDPENP